VIDASLLENPNLAMLEIAVQALGDLCESLVFVGGCATGLLVTTVRAHHIRATKDVDVVTRVATIRDYHNVEARLSQQGFKHDTSPDAPICRWIRAGITLDLMPSEPGVLSFHNRWYPLAVDTAQPARLPSGRTIALIAAPVFIATKLEAFWGRGGGDFLMSHDVEDIVTVVDGRPSTTDEVRAGPADLREYLGRQFRELTASTEFLDALAGHLPRDSASQARLPELIRRLRILAQNAPLSPRY
jgi:predicted nucleotidyltransferase